MGDFPDLTACLNCRILYKPEQLRGPNCVKCGAKLQAAPEAIVRAKHRVKEKRRRRKQQSDAAATRKDKSLGKRSTTQKVDVPTIGPVRRSRSLDQDSDSDALNVVNKVATADELLSALESAPISDEAVPKKRSKKSRERGRSRKRRSKKPDGSLFIPLDTFVDKQGNPGVPGQAPIADLFGASGQIGDSGITAQTEKARRGQLGDLEEKVHFGDYELNQVLGRGGMGVVYKATQRSLGREVALKLMSSQNIADEDRIRFQREAKAAARLRHPHIVPIFDIGTHNGHDYFTLELIDGQDLHKLAMERQITEREAMEAVRKVALAIDYAHEQGVIHRDLKPHNILIDRAGEPHVTDFGLAKDLQDAVNLTTAGIALGSPPYMPPEQAMGNYDQVDAVSDVYGLGTILYECLAARPPFLGETPYEIIAKVQSQDPVAPSHYSPDISNDAEVICLKAMDKVKGGRYQSAKELAEDLERALAGDPIVARPPTLTVKLARRLVKYRFQVTSLAISLAVVVAMAIFASSVYKKNNRPVPSGEIIDYREVATDQKGSPIDQSLAAARSGRFLQGLGLLAGAFEGNPVPRAEWLREAENQVSNVPEESLRPLLFKALDKTSAGSQGDQLQVQLLLDALASLISEVQDSEAEGYIRAATSLLKLYSQRSLGGENGANESDAEILDRIAQLPAIKKQVAGQSRRGDAEVAKSLATVFFQAIRAGYSRQRGQVESARSLMIQVLKEKAPAPAILPFAEAMLKLEGGARSESGQTFLSRFSQSFANHPHKAVIKSLRLALPPPRVDPSSGHIRAPNADFRNLRWRFPSCVLGDPKKESLLGNQELLRVAGKAAYPTNPVLSVEGDRVYIGWLGFVYIIDNESGNILERIRVPARIHSLRSFKDGFLVATIIRSSGRAINEPKYEDILVDPNGGRLRRLIPGYGDTGPFLAPSHRIGFEPLVRQSLQTEADSWLGWSPILKQEKYIRDKDIALWRRGYKYEKRKQILKKDQEKLRGLARDRLEVVELFAGRDSRQPWLLLRRATLFHHLGEMEKASKSADDAVVATSQVRNEYLTPFEEVRIAVELEDLGYHQHVNELLEHAYRTLIRDYRYVPEYAGFGENDPGQILTKALDRIIARVRRSDQIDGKGRRAYLERYLVIESWRDAFAPALASSAAARKAKRRAFGKAKVNAPEFPRPLSPDSEERLDSGFAGIGLKSIIFLDLLLFGATKYILFFGLFVVSLTSIGVYRRQRRDLQKLGYETFQESMKAWYTNPMLRLQHSFPSYWTIRDRIGLCLTVLLFLIGLAIHDTIISSLDTRETAPRALFMGLPGHPQALEYLHEKHKNNPSTETASLLAYALAQSEENELAIAVYRDLAKETPDPNAFNAALLGEFGKLQGPEQRSQLADKLDLLVEENHPENYWARYALTRDPKAKEQALKLAPQRISLIDKFDTLKPILVAPTREKRDEVVLGRSYWWSSFFKNLLFTFLSTQDIDELTKSCQRVLGENRQGTAELVSFRTELFFLVPAIVLVVLSSLLLPGRNRDSNTPKASRIRRIDYLFPGVPQLLRGYAPSGVLLGSALILLVRYIAEGRAVKVFPFQRLAMLVGEAGSSEGAVYFSFRLFLILALIGLLGIHAFQLRRLSAIYGVAQADESSDEEAEQTLPEPMLVDS